MQPRQLKSYSMQSIMGVLRATIQSWLRNLKRVFLALLNVQPVRFDEVGTVSVLPNNPSEGFIGQILNGAASEAKIALDWSFAGSPLFPVPVKDSKSSSKIRSKRLPSLRRQRQPKVVYPALVNGRRIQNLGNVFGAEFKAKFKSQNIQAAAMVMGKHGTGWVLLWGPHPEQNPNFDQYYVDILINILPENKVVQTEDGDEKDTTTHDADSENKRPPINAAADLHATASSIPSDQAADDDIENSPTRTKSPRVARSPFARVSTNMVEDNHDGPKYPKRKKCVKHYRYIKSHILEW